eukprot:515167-Rhodomonas_salina.1
MAIAVALNGARDGVLAREARARRPAGPPPGRTQERCRRLLLPGLLSVAHHDERMHPVHAVCMHAHSPRTLVHCVCTGMYAHSPRARSWTTTRCAAHYMHLCLRDTVSLVPFLSEQGQIESAQYPAMWQAIPPSNQ